jgi:hypothetical protein
VKYLYHATTKSCSVDVHHPCPFQGLSQGPDLFDLIPTHDGTIVIQ